jgi:CRP/FNR family cyclic AMP-dependent transcriptional regulator
MRFVLKNDSLKIDANQVLFMEGDVGNDMYIIKSGQVKILKLQGNNMVTLASLGPGAIIGEMSLMDNEMRMATAKTETLTELIVINQSLLQATYKKLPSWLVSMIQILVKRLRSTQALKTIRDLSESIPTIMYVFLQQSRSSSEQSLSIPLNALARETSLIYGLDIGNTKKVIRLLAKEGYWEIKSTANQLETLVTNNPDILLFTLEHHRSTYDSNYSFEEDFSEYNEEFFLKHKEKIILNWDNLIKEKL